MTELVFPGRSRYSTLLLDDGTLLRGVHSLEECALLNCVVHNPSDHAMRNWPTAWEDPPWGLGYTMRVNPETGEKIPDPDCLAFHEFIGHDPLGYLST